MRGWLLSPSPGFPRSFAVRLCRRRASLAGAFPAVTAVTAVAASAASAATPPSRRDRSLLRRPVTHSPRSLSTRAGTSQRPTAHDIRAFLIRNVPGHVWDGDPAAPTPRFPPSPWTSIAARSPVPPSDLATWLFLRPAFPWSHAPAFITALLQPHWPAATLALADDEPHWALATPASVLAVVAQKASYPGSAARDVSEALHTLAHRLAVAPSGEEDAIADLLYGLARLAVKCQQTTILWELAEYVTEYSVRLATVSNHRQAMHIRPPCDPEPPLDSLAGSAPATPIPLRPILSVLSGLLRGPPSLERAMFTLQERLLGVLFSLCGSFAETYAQLSPSDARILLRACLAHTPPPQTRKPLRNPPSVVADVDQLARALRLGVEDEALLNVAVRRFYALGHYQAADMIARRRHKVLGRAGDPPATLATIPSRFRFFAPNQRRTLANDDGDASVILEWLLPHLTVLYGPLSLADACTAILVALNRHLRPTAARSIWNYMLAQRALLTPRALEAAMRAALNANTPHHAIELFRAHSIPHNGAEGSAKRDPRRTEATEKMLAYAMLALTRSRQFDAVWTMWKDLSSHWSVQPNEFHLHYLLNAARRCTLQSAERRAQRGPPCGGKAQLPDAVGYDPGVWDGRPACHRAVDLFWEALYGSWPAVAAGIAARRAGRHSMLGRLLRPAEAAAARKPAHPLDLPAATVLPSLRYDMPHARQLLPTPGAFKEMVELLGVSGRGGDIPILLEWMRALKVDPPAKSGFVAAAYFWYRRQRPSGTEMRALDHCVSSWLGEEALPTSQVLATAAARRGETGGTV